jgi:hypothetical protein
MEHGHNTAKMGETLEKWLDGQNHPNLKVYYDHGQKRLSKVVPFFGDYSRATTLAFVDCAVVDTARGRALVLCEIEEKGAAPKKVIGDVCNLLLAESLCIGGEKYSFDDALIVIGIRVQDGGQSEAKAKAICRRIKRMVTPKRLRDLRIRVRAETNCDDLVETVLKDIQGAVRKASAHTISTSSRRAVPRRPCRSRTGSRRPQS